MRTHDDHTRAAARLTVMMLRAPQDGLASAGTAPPGESSDLGTTAFRLLPDDRRLSELQLETWLADAPKPLVATPTYLRGVIAVWPQLTATWVAHALANQAKVLTMYRNDYGLDDDSPITMVDGDRREAFSFADLEEWGRTYGVEVGWNLRRLDAGGDADAEIALITPGARGHLRS